mgnify:CR=1 FL=1
MSYEEKRSNQNRGHYEGKSNNIIASILRVIAGLIVVIGIFIGIANIGNEIFIGIIYIVSSIVLGMFIVGFAEIIDLLNKIAINTTNR